MTFQEILDQVLLITKRRDQMAMTESAVRIATLKVHNKDFFYRDIREESGQLQFPSCVTTLNPKQLFPLFRKVRYITPWHFDRWNYKDQGGPGKGLTPIELGNERDSYGYVKQNVFYMAGENLRILTAFPLSHFLIGAYVHPNTTKEGYSSWIADDYPQAIIHEAARYVAHSLGMRELAAAQQSLVAEAYGLLTINNIAQPGE